MALCRLSRFYVQTTEGSLFPKEQRQDRQRFSIMMGLLCSVIVSSIIFINRAFLLPLFNSNPWPNWGRITLVGVVIHVLVFWLFFYIFVRYSWSRGKGRVE
jgi:Na+-driven multidrug efflux pump